MPTRILVVEDDELLRSLICQFLDASGFEVAEVGDCAAALRVLQGDAPAPDLVLSDLQLPDVDGGALASTVRNLGIDVPFLFMSGKSAGALSLLNILPPELPVLQKPFPFSRLRGAIEQALLLHHSKTQASSNS